jgi:hypothetical protein
VSLPGCRSEGPAGDCAIRKMAVTARAEIDYEIVIDGSVRLSSLMMETDETHVLLRLRIIPRVRRPCITMSCDDCPRSAAIHDRIASQPLLII